MDVSPRKRYTFFIDDELADALKQLKKRDGMPESEAVRRAIAAFVVKRGIPVRSRPTRTVGTRSRS